MITYERLWETLKERGISTYKLVTEHELSRGTLDSLRHNRSITMATLNELCGMIGCRPEDIISYEEDEKEEEGGG